MCGTLALTLVAAVLLAPETNWDLPLFGILLVFSIFSYSPSSWRWSSSAERRRW